MIHQRIVKIGVSLLICLLFSKIYSVTSMPTSTLHDFEHGNFSLNEFTANSTAPSVETTDKQQIELEYVLIELTGTPSIELTETPTTTEQQTLSTELSPSEGETTPSILPTEVYSDVTTEISSTEGTTLSMSEVTEVISPMHGGSLDEENQDESQVNVSTGTDAPTMPEEPLFLVKTESPEIDEGATVSPDVTTEIITPTETTGTEVYYPLEKKVNDEIQSEVMETTSETWTTTEENSGSLGVGTEAPVTETQTSRTSVGEIEGVQVKFLLGDSVLNDRTEVELTDAPDEIILPVEDSIFTTEIGEDLSLTDSTTMSTVVIIEQRKLNETLSVFDKNLIMKNNNQSLLINHEVTEEVLIIESEESSSTTISLKEEEGLLSGEMIY